MHNAPFITWTGFVRYFTDNAKYVPATLRDDVRREAQQRCRRGRADGPVNFGDLVVRMERAVGAIRCA